MGMHYFYLAMGAHSLGEWCMRVLAGAVVDVAVVAHLTQELLVSLTEASHGGR